MANGPTTRAFTPGARNGAVGAGPCTAPPRGMDWRAQETLWRLKQVCARQTGRWNTWREGDRTYFFHERPGDASKGEPAILGTVFLAEADGSTTPAGRFCIQAGGRLLGPGYLHALLAGGHGR